MGDPDDFDRLVGFPYAYACVIVRINTMGTKEISEVVGFARGNLAGELSLTP